jgi:hypothetical protein
MGRRVSFGILVAVLASCLLVACSGGPVAGEVPQSGAKAGPAALYPNPSLTPGDVLPGVTAKEICVPGYSSSVRDVNQSEKDEVYRRYGIKNEPGKAEVDHFISLELGGSNALTNLWPEPYEPKPGAHEKDTVENYLHAQVCKGAMTLPEAQDQIRTDWYAVFLKIQKP